MDGMTIAMISPVPSFPSSLERTDNLGLASLVWDRAWGLSVCRSVSWLFCALRGWVVRLST